VFVSKSEGDKSANYSTGPTFDSITVHIPGARESGPKRLEARPEGGPRHPLAVVGPDARRAAVVHVDGTAPATHVRLVRRSNHHVCQKRKCEVRTYKYF